MDRKLCDNKITWCNYKVKYNIFHHAKIQRTNVDFENYFANELIKMGRFSTFSTETIFKDLKIIVILLLFNNLEKNRHLENMPLVPIPFGEDPTIPYRSNWGHRLFACQIQLCSVLASCRVLV